MSSASSATASPPPAAVPAAAPAEERVALARNNQRVSALAEERVALERQRTALEQQGFALEQHRAALDDQRAALDRQGIVLDNQRRAFRDRCRDAFDEHKRIRRALRDDGELTHADREALRAAMWCMERGSPGLPQAPRSPANSEQSE